MKKTALIHYWLVRMRGGENVVQAIAELLPQAELFTHVHAPEALEGFEGRKIHASFINDLPFAKKVYPLYLPFMFQALEQFDLADYDLVISSEAGPAKGVIPAPGARHICYVHSPMRYLWDQRLIYRRKVPAPLRPIFDHVTHDLRRDDVLSAARVDQFVANSNFVKTRIERYYRRDALVIHPPVTLDDLVVSEPEDFYLFAGHHSGYKRQDLAIAACERLGRRLVVAGEAPAAWVRKHRSRLVDFTGRVSRAKLVDLMSRCRALLFPGVEDFGIIPVEVMGCGRPVIAFAGGGALETVSPGVSGLLFDDQSVDGLCRAITAFEHEQSAFKPDNCVAWASSFSKSRFQEAFQALVDGVA
jgi:glycosyltransferase involved in cell wall biosynthesis